MKVFATLENIVVLITILIFSTLIGYSIWCRNSIKEGATGEYQELELQDDPLYIAKVNAANIAYLKEQIDTITDIKRDVNEMKQQVDSNSYAVQSLNTSMQNTGAQSIPDQQTTQNLVNTGNANATVS